MYQAPAIRCGGAACLILEDLAKVSGVGKAAGGGNIAYLQLTLKQQLLRLLNADAAQIFHGRCVLLGSKQLEEQRL